MGKPQRNRPRGRPRPRWEGKVEMDLKEIFGMLWTTLIWLRVETWRALVNTVMNIRVHKTRGIS